MKASSLRKNILRRALALLLAAILLAPGLPASAEELTPETYWKQISAGWYHSLGVTADGVLWAWGSNNYGQLGTEDEASHFLPVQVMTDVAWAEAGESHSMAIKTDGTLWVWGNNDCGQLGLGIEDEHQYEPVKLMDHVKMVSSSYLHTLAVKTDGTLWVWGDNEQGQLGMEDVEYSSAPVKLMDHVKFAAAGYFHSAAIKEDGSLWLWGSNQKARLGIGSMESRVVLEPQMVLEGAARVALSEDLSCAVLENGDLYTWGSNTEGQLGTNDKTTRAEPVKVGEGFVDVQAGRTHLVALSEDGYVYTSGNNFHGQVGDGTGVDSMALGTVPNIAESHASITPLGDVTAISSHNDHTFVIRRDGRAYAWGGNYFGQLGNGTGMDAVYPVLFTGGRFQTPEPLKETPDFSRVKNTFAAGSAHNLAILEDGSLYVWGYNKSGQTGLGVANDQVEPGLLLPEVKFSTVAAGEASSYAVTEEGVLYAWGSNSYGQLGLGHKENQYEPQKVMEDVAYVTSGSYFAMAVKTDGTLWAWGDNSYGQLGTGDTLSSTEPVLVMDGVQKAAAGSIHAIAMRTDGSLWVWGNGDYGQLGFSSDTACLIPLMLIDSRAADIAAGEAFSAARMDDGSLWMWGDNSRGQIGDYQDNAEAEAGKSEASDSSDTPSGSNITSLYSPVQVMENVFEVSLGLYHSLAVKNDGVLVAWGLGESGQLSGDTTSSQEPRTVDRRVVAVSGGGLHTLYQKADGSLWGVGYNASGQLGYAMPEDAEEGEEMVVKPVLILKGVRLSDKALEFKQNELKFSFVSAVKEIPLAAWLGVGAALLLVVLVLWIVFSQRRIRRLRKAAVTAVEQARLLQRENEQLRESKGTQRRRRKTEHEE